MKDGDGPPIINQGFERICGQCITSHFHPSTVHTSQFLQKKRLPVATSTGRDSRAALSSGCRDYRDHDATLVKLVFANGDTEGPKVKSPTGYFFFYL